MRMDGMARWWLGINRLVSVAAVLAVLVLIAWLSTRYPVAAEWSTSERGELADSTVQLLERAEGQLEIVAFVRPDDFLAGHVRGLLSRYQRHHPNLESRIVNPDAHPDLVQEFGIEGHGEMIVAYEGRQERVAVPSEARLSGALQSILQTRDRPVVYAAGSGGRDLQGQSDRDLGVFGGALNERGHQLQALQAAAGQSVPEQASVLVVAGALEEWPDSLHESVEGWLGDGGNLLWLVEDPDDAASSALSELLPVEALSGTVVEPRAEELLGVNEPRLLVVGDYPRHPALERLEGSTLLVGAHALELLDGSEEWGISPLLRTAERHWVERDDPDSPEFDADAGDRRGPLTVGLTLARSAEGGGEQRIAVVGNTTFLSNAYVDNGANLQLGLELTEWLTAGTGAGGTPGQPVPDQTLALEQWQVFLLGAVFLFGLPLLLLAGGGIAWWRRRSA